MMDEPHVERPDERSIFAKHAWTVDEVWTATRYYQRFRCNLLITLGVYLAGILIFIIGLQHGYGFEWFIVVCLAYIIFTRARFPSRQMIQRRLSKSLDQNKEIKWVITDEKLFCSIGTYESSSGWDRISKVVQTSKGFLVYYLHYREMYSWFPNTAFSSPADRQRFQEIVKSKINDFKVEK